MSALRWSIRTLDRALDGETVYRELLAPEPVAFWLDATSEPAYVRTTGETSRQLFGRNAGWGVSVLGTSVGEGVIVRDLGDGDVFGELGELLAARAAEPPAELAGLFCGGYVGYFGYELKALTGGVAAHDAPTPDALWIWANRFVVIDHRRDRTHLVALDEPGVGEDWLDRAEEVASNWWMGSVDRPAIARLDLEAHLEQDRPTYLTGIARCLAELEAGQTYEVNLTNRVRLPAVQDPFEFFCWQRSANPAPYAAFLRYGDLAVASSSPERFLTVDADGWAESRPIKGTAPRAPDPAQDQLAAKALAEDDKTRAENLMIVDLIRNDLGRVSVPGTVNVPQLMQVESYRTVHQLVTTVRGRLRDGVTAVDAVRACFPPGSMTGAPKIRTMEIIDSLEWSARGVYSGALGYLTVDGRADLSVVIRTAVLTPDETVVGAGGAIVLDSDPVAEYDEMVLKATAAVGGKGGGHE